MTEQFTQAEDIRCEVKSIVEDVERTGVTFEDGTTGRVGFMSSLDGLNLKTRNGLYSGQIGIALYFAAMYQYFEDEIYREKAEQAVDFIFDRDEEELVDTAYIGAGAGVGSLVYGLDLLSELTDNQRYRNRAADLVSELSKEIIEDDDQYDMLLGAAGTVTGLLRHWEHSDNSEALDKAILCGEHLLDSRYDKWADYKLWDTSRKEGTLSTSTGMGHGVAGISYSLYRLYQHTQRDAFRVAARNALEFENLFYSKHQHNWKSNFVGIKHYSHWWCNGLAGIGHARLGSLQYRTSETLERDMNRVRNGLEPQLLAEDSVCHGTFAQINLLIDLGRMYDEQYLEAAWELASDAIERRRRAGSYRVDPGHIDGIDNPVFFLGTTGVGYTLLRLLAPAEIPSVLRFE
ncbi:lanthionine synthetase LanC family protein [Halorussus sp. MSC15.2]|uniref:lanthionine synthetase LanC family protein n=1 Tax=Halorussus sp. MSC15.2 TaxID=2283638 RepID=UPI0013D14F49|nr:lanthionine synthetase LanC family protein [Halorussus sp. MSC15.2]NEU58712.1 hypothetical protein [Halorussus sp. MSC15.2]